MDMLDLENGLDEHEEELARLRARVEALEDVVRHMLWRGSVPVFNGGDEIFDAMAKRLGLVSPDGKTVIGGGR